MLFRVLPKEQIGVWVLFLSITSIVEVGRIGLLQNALVKFLSTQQGEEAGRITTASFLLNGILTSLIVVMFLLLSPVAADWFQAPELVGLFKIYCLTTVALIPFFQCNYVQQANLDFKGIFWGNFVKGGVLFSYIAWLFFQKQPVPLVSLALAQVAAAVAASVVAWLFAKKFTRFSQKVDWAWVKRLFDYGIFVFGTNLSTQIFKNIDKLLLGGLPGGGTAAVALYDAAIKVTNLTDVPTASMATMLFPQSARRVQDGKDALKQLYEKAVGAILAFMLPCIAGVMLLAEWIIGIVAGPGYEEAANLLRITILFGFFMPYAVQFGTVLDSMGRPEVNFVYTILSLLLATLLNLVFIWKMGAYGAAIGSLLAYAITFVFMQAYLRKHLGINALKPFGYMVGFYQQAFGFAMKLAKNARHAAAVVEK